jgi:hypothetical protein
VGETSDAHCVSSCGEAGFHGGKDDDVWTSVDARRRLAIIFVAILSIILAF